MTTKVALWVRVSSGSQHEENQIPALMELASRRGWQIVKTYTVEASAWRGHHEKALSQVYHDAHLGRFDILLVWALDRLSRQGVLAMLQVIDRLSHYGVRVVSAQESWTEVDGQLKELLLSVVSWVARMESERRSERTKLGLKRALAEGKKLGRPPGRLDTRKRKRRGALKSG